MTEQKSAADKTLSHLEKRKDEVEKLWGIIGQAAISGNSQNYANKAKETADNAREIIPAQSLNFTVNS